VNFDSSFRSHRLLRHPAGQLWVGLFGADFAARDAHALNDFTRRHDGHPEQQPSRQHAAFEVGQAVGGSELSPEGPAGACARGQFLTYRPSGRHKRPTRHPQLYEGRDRPDSHVEACRHNNGSSRLRFGHIVSYRIGPGSVGNACSP